MRETSRNSKTWSTSTNVRSVESQLMIGNSRNNDPPAEADEGAYVLPFRDLLLALWRNLWVIALTVLVSAAAAVGLSLVQQPVYEASIKVLVGQESGLTDTPMEVSGLQDLTETMVEAVNSRPVAEAAIQQADLKATPETLLEERLSVEQIGETQFIEVSYQDLDPKRAQRVVNIVGEVFSERISNLSSETNTVTATIWSRAALPDQPISPNPVRNGLLAAMLGAVLGVGLAFLLDYLNDRWQSPEEAEQISGVPTYGVIPHFEAPESKKRKGKQ